MTVTLGSPAAMRDWSQEQRLARRTVGVVPTMGALHAGHIHLVKTALERCDRVVVTIFVNPLQFNRSDDFDKYPRPIDDDVRMCAEAGAHAVYAPTAAAMYPTGFQTHVVPGPLADVLEGSSRPGHFRGVTTVVTKLFAATVPHVAFFGEKDFQQLAVIRRMTFDLDLGIDIVGVPTVREPDGLAMSSRNRRLTPDQRRAAACVPRALFAARDAFAEGERDSGVLQALAERVIDAEPAARRDYVSVDDAATLTALSSLDGPAIMSCAVWFGEVRLIDNVRLGSDPVSV